MSGRSRSDDEILADFRRRVRRSGVRAITFVLASLVYIAVCSALYGVAVGSGFLARHGISEHWYLLMPLPVLLAVLLLLRREKSPKLEELPKRILQREIDTYQRRWRWFVFALLLCQFALTLCLSMLDRFAALNRPRELPLLAVYFFVTLGCALFAVFYPGLRVIDDDGFRALRGRTAKVGYVSLLMAFGGGFLAASIHPAWIVQAFIWALFAGLAVPVLTYVFLDWRSDSSSNEGGMP